MDELVRLILTLGAPDLATEQAACDAFVRVRWPRGLPPCRRCRAPLARDGIRLVCAGPRPHRCTVLMGTPLGTKLRPRLRAIFLAIRAFAVTPRGLSARELAREIGADHVTLWRHLHTLRVLLPPRVAHPTGRASAIAVCKRPTPAWARVGARNAMTRVLSPPSTKNDAERLVGESVRTWVNGTFHGVSARWLGRYLDEAAARWRVGAAVVEELAAPFIEGAPALVFRVVIPPRLML